MVYEKCCPIMRNWTQKKRRPKRSACWSPVAFLMSHISYLISHIPQLHSYILTFSHSRRKWVPTALKPGWVLDLLYLLTLLTGVPYFNLFTLLYLLMGLARCARYIRIPINTYKNIQIHTQIHYKIPTNTTYNYLQVHIKYIYIYMC